MRKVLGRVAAALIIGALVTPLFVTSAFAAGNRYEAVAGNFGSMSSATHYATVLGQHGLKGFVVETENTGTKGHFQVEITFSTKAAALAEVAKLKAAHYRGGVETDSGTGV